MGCVECDGGLIAASYGYTPIIRDDDTVSFFSCKYDGACNGTQCVEGFGGTLCGVCDEGYTEESDGACTKCEGTTGLGVVAAIVILLLVVVLFANIEKFYDNAAALKTIVELVRELELQAISKVLVATMQIITSFTKVLNIPFPESFRALLRFLAIFQFDLSLTLGIGCLYNNSYFTSLAVGFVVVIATVLMVCASYLYSVSRASDETHLRDMFAKFDKDGNGIAIAEVLAMVERMQLSTPKAELEAMFADADTDKSGRLDFDEFLAAFGTNLGLGKVLQDTIRAKARNDSLGRLFLLVFVLYPGLTNKVFEIFLCRDLGPNTSPGSVLHADYDLDCDATAGFRWTVGATLVLVWPIAVPAVLFGLMFRVRKELREEEEDVTSMFSFLVADYKPQHWYWEPVELVRKLLLSGILSLVGRGSIAQAALGTAISFAFFALHLKVEPYKTSTLNFVKAVSEVQLFVVLQTSVILQQYNVGFDSETLQPEAYGDIQTVATALIAPVIVFLIAYNVKGLGTSGDDDELDEDNIMDVNPLHVAIEAESDDDRGELEQE